MADDQESTLPIECRDQYQEAEQYYNSPLRVENRALKNEILSLKRLLRENSIPWDSTMEFGQASKRIKTRVTRSSMRSTSAITQCPPLPVEIQLQILTHALTAKDPIIDPFCKLKMENLTEKEQRRRENGPQLAIGLLSTCRAYQVEGTRILWTRNVFVFTTYQALREFCNVPFEFRSKVECVTFRIVGHYFDEDKKCQPGPRRLKAIRTSSGRQRTVRVTARPKEDSAVARKGFRSYTWTQVIDFLSALQPPFDPSHTGFNPRPRLLPALKSLRMDFVDFPNDGRPADVELHSLAFHDLGCTLDELMVTGLPDGMRASKVLSDLTGMVKDDGLLLKSKAAFIAKPNFLSTRADNRTPSAQVVRSWKPLAMEWGEYFPDDFDEDEWDFHDFHDHHHHHPVGDLPVMPPAPAEEGHPESDWLERSTIWKRVPKHRDSEERKWVEFGRVMGTPVGPYSDARDVEDEGELVCPTCGIMHDPAGWDL